MQRADATHKSPDDLHLHKLGAAYRVASVVLTGLGAVWMIWMESASRWELVAINFTYVVVGIMLWRSVNRPSFRRMAALTHLLVFCALVQICLLYDVPNAAAPRVAHLYFLSSAFLFYVTFRQTSPVLTNLGVLVYLAAFTLFSGTNFVLPIATPLPDDMRIFGSWMHTIVALSIMCACVYIMQSEFAARARLARQLTTALAERQFELYLQPQVGDDTIVGAEALIRWNHPRRGLVQPGEFLPSAEQLGLMVPLGKQVLAEACERLARWQADPRAAHLTLAVNVSASQFLDPTFVDDVKRIVTQAGISPDRLELELTESVVVGDPDDVIAKMHELVAFGVRLALDDFGTGYSSLQYLRRMPFGKLKIDRSFVRDMMRDERDSVIVKGIIQLGRELHLSIVAEGVESPQQKRTLMGMGCREFQGYLFGKPMPPPEFERLLALPGERRFVA